MFVFTMFTSPYEHPSLSKKFFFRNGAMQVYRWYMTKCVLLILQHQAFCVHDEPQSQPIYV